MSVVQAVAQWGQVILTMLPQIVKVGHDLYALWCNMRGTQQQNAAVLRAMKVLNRYQDDIGRVLQDPEQKRELLEGLTVLMNRINEHERGNMGTHCGNTNSSFPMPPHSDGASGFTPSKPSPKGRSYKLCDVCQDNYNTTDRRPTILICGHTFCRECLRHIHENGPLICPTCRTRERRPLSTLPPNSCLISVLDEEAYQDNDDSCCGGKGGGCDDNSLSFEQQIEYAILLSQQQAQQQGQDSVEAHWREVEDAESEKLAMALQFDEIYEASRLCAQRHEAERNNEGFNLSKKKGVCEQSTLDASPPPSLHTASSQSSLHSAASPPPYAAPSPPPYATASLSTSPPHAAGEDDEEASLRLALELQQAEVVWMHKQYEDRGGCRGASGKAGDDSDWLSDYRTYFGTSLCDPFEEKQKGEESKTAVTERDETEDGRGGEEWHREEQAVETTAGVQEDIEERDTCYSGSEAERWKKSEERDDLEESCGMPCYGGGCGKDRDTYCHGSETDDSKRSEEREECGGTPFRESDCTREDRDTCCDGSETDGKKGSEEGEECGSSFRGDDCSNECEFLMKEEMMLVQEAIRLSLQE